ncbi:low affinity iron permease family protein [Hymenobacter lucidus]|uniref:Low affinity iron permease family protein n=1 Tax=Hymenobacter lucidus TaxID=2880930 RepID=A0ABS8AUP3_9BACT|nr:low affinity iron permease family protein [Hymenobacter lucidus]MCB2408767.1 low affinity iron permease family protein [Hymenobacter lucidus]
MNHIAQTKEALGPPAGPATAFFARLAERITKFSGTTLAFCVAAGLVLVWALTGPLFQYSETWQLVINTSTTIITFLMVFLIQRAQNKDSLVLHLKLNELIAATKGASNRLINAQDFTEDEINILHQYYCLLAEKAQKENDLGRTHTVEEAEENHQEKVEAHQPKAARRR